MLLYFFLFFVFFALLLALPDLLEALRTTPPATTIEEERAAGARIARAALEGKLPWALLAAIAGLAAGAWAQVLPGLKRPRV
jgi:hypothetical protein